MLANCAKIHHDGAIGGHQRRDVLDVTHWHSSVTRGLLVHGDTAVTVSVSVTMSLQTTHTFQKIGDLVKYDEPIYGNGLGVCDGHADVCVHSNT